MLHVPFKLSLGGHPLQPSNDDHANSRHTSLSLIVGLLQSLGGHVHGDHVLHAIARGDASAVERVECSLTSSAMGFVASVLEAAGCRVSASASPARPLLYALSVYAPCDPRTPVSVELTTYTSMHHSSSSLPPTVFDWQHVVSCRTRLYLRRMTSSCQTLPSLEAHLHRARLGVFCLSPACPPSAEDEAEKVHGKAMCRAARLVLERGWRMDDLLAGRRGWVASRWDLLPSARRHDQQVSRLQPAIAGLHDTCPICYERFRAADVVVNLPCNHNFHAACHSPQHQPPPFGASLGGGICAWLAAGNHSCPCCRAEVFLGTDSAPAKA